MTVIKPIDSEYGALKTSHVNDMLQKHWGSTHTIKVFREPNTSLGISIVGGKVSIWTVLNLAFKTMILGRHSFDRLIIR